MLKAAHRVVLAGGFVALLLGGPAPASLAQSTRGVFVINDPLSEYAIGKRDFDAESDPRTGRQRHLPLSENQQWQQVVEAVGRRLVSVVVSDTDVSAWTFVVRKHPSVNAHAHPGGFICVYEGLLAWLADPRTGQVDEGRLAAVLAHEIAHVTRQHLSNALTQTIALTDFLRLPDKEREEKRKAALLAAFSRTNEIEADQFGSLYLVRAGYSFADAVRVWEAMRRDFGGKRADRSSQAKGHAQEGTIELETYPTDSERLEALKAYQAAVLRPALERFNLGEELLRNNFELETAVEIFKSLKQNFPTSAEVRNNLAVALHKLYLSRRLPEELGGLPDLAIYPAKNLSDKIRMQTRSRADHRLLRQSIEEYKAALASAATPQTMSNLAWAFLEMGEKSHLERAEELLAHAAELAPEDPFVLNARGMLLRKRGNLDQATALFAKAAQRSVPARYNLGYALLETGMKTKAVEALLAYLEDDPSSVWGERVRAQLVALGERPPATPTLPPVREFAGIQLGAPSAKVRERFGEPVQRVKAEANSERWSYPEVGLEFLLMFDSVQRITQTRLTGGESRLPFPLERKVAGVGLDDSKSKVEAVFGKGAVRKRSGATPVEWLTFEPAGVDFALSEGRVFAFMVHNR